MKTDRGGRLGRREVGTPGRSPAVAGLLRRGGGLPAIIIAFTCVAAIAGSLLVARQRRQLMERAVGYVDAFLTFRSGELQRWLDERRGDAMVAGRDPLLAAALETPGEPQRRQAEERLALIAHSYGYRALLVVDREGRRRFGFGDDPLPAGAPARVRAAIETDRIQIAGPLRRIGTPDGLTFELITPVHAGADTSAPCLGAVVLLFDPSDIITGVFGVAPAASRSGEAALMVHAEGAPFVLYPKRRGSARPWLVPRSDLTPNSPEGLFARGADDFSGACDDDGEPVIAATRALPEFDGVVIGHIRDTEMLAPATRALWLTVGLLAALFLGVALVARFRWISRAREALLSEEEKFKIIFETMQDAYLLSKLDGTILLVNPALVKMLGYGSEAEILGKNTQTDVFVEAADRLRLKEKLAADGEARGFKTTFKRADGTPVIVEGNVHLVRDERGAPFGVEGLIRDMTTHYQIRADLIAAREAAEVATQGKSQFLSNASHEIRTPLNAIVGFGHLLLASELPARARDYVAKIHSSARILLHTVDDVLDFSKIEAGKLELERTPFRLDEVIEDLVSVLAVQADGKGISFVVKVQPDVPRSLIGDPLRLAQVLTNLVGNAIKFTDKGGVTLNVARAGERDGESMLRFSVEDTGIGITTEQLARIFEPFTQADGSTTRRFGGTGLGLAICRQVVEAMGGRLAATSVPGSGSTFVVEVGFRVSAADVSSAGREPDQAAGSFLSTPPLRLRGSRVLVVEDNAVNQQVARELLESAGVVVTAADSGRAAVALVGSSGGKLDAVLMDVQMPGMDGVAATRAIRALVTSGDLPIIAMTAHAEAAERERCLSAGMNDYVAKPFEPAQLFKTLARWLKDRDRGPAEAQHEGDARARA